MELSVYKIDGTESGKKVVLDENVFGIEPNDHVIYLDVLQYMRNQRQGTSKTKDRSEVAYSTKKLGRQKGFGFQGWRCCLRRDRPSLSKEGW